jgi:predicted outer membrane repeat protein
MKLETSLKSMMLVSAFLLAICYTSAAGQIIYVDADANGLNDGTSWDNAYNYLQDGLADAASAPKPLEIRVAQGVYKPDRGVSQTPGDRYATFRLIGGVTIKGGYAGFGEPDPDARDIELYETILSGDLAGNDVDVNDPRELYDEPSRSENSYHVTTIYEIEESVVLDGFTITAGNANGYPWEYSSGGGMFNRPQLGGRPTITNCTFTKNSARTGGGMFNFDNNSVVNKCTFAGNGADYDGGGIYNAYGSPEFEACTFIGNSAQYGGGMVSWEASPMADDCLFIGNVASGGGGIYSGNSSPKVCDCILIDNSAEWGGG